MLGVRKLEEEPLVPACAVVLPATLAVFPNKVEARRDEVTAQLFSKTQEKMFEIREVSVVQTGRPKKLVA